MAILVVFSCISQALYQHFKNLHSIHNTISSCNSRQEEALIQHTGFTCKSKIVNILTQSNCEVLLDNVLSYC